MSIEFAYETLVMHYLVRQGRFVAPQFDIRSAGQAWSCPDFVALDFKNRRIEVVEVTTSQDVRNLISKIQDAENQWFSKLRPQLKAGGVPIDDWDDAVSVFAYRKQADAIKQKACCRQSLQIYSLEEIACPSVLQSGNRTSQ
jgi:hypothetical protein